MIVERERVARAERQNQPSGERVLRGESSQRARERAHATRQAEAPAMLSFVREARMRPSFFTDLRHTTGPSLFITPRRVIVYYLYVLPVVSSLRPLITASLHSLESPDSTHFRSTTCPGPSETRETVAWRVFGESSLTCLHARATAPF